MKVLAVFFILLSFSIFKVLYNNSQDEAPRIYFPVLELPEREFTDLSAGCGGFTDCIEYLAEVIQNIGNAFVVIVLFIIELFTYVVDLLVLLFEVSFTGIEGAPWWINSIFTMVIGGSIAFIGYRLFRSGESNA